VENFTASLPRAVPRNANAEQRVEKNIQATPVCQSPPQTINEAWPQMKLESHCRTCIEVAISDTTALQYQ